MDRIFERMKFWPMPARRDVTIIAAVLLIAVALAIATTLARRAEPGPEAGIVEQSPRTDSLFHPTAKQWGMLTVEPVTREVFRSEHLTEGKIGIDEDRATLVFSPYSGRVLKLLAKPGDTVTAGQGLFVVEAPDMVQAQNDFISAVAGLNKAKAALELAEIIERQNRSLYETRAAPLRDVQQSQAATSAARNDLRAAETAREVVRNRLRILGLTDDEINKFSETGDVSPQTVIHSPIAGTVVQRKIGPGQYVNTSSNNPGASDPVFVIGDLSTVWLIAYVRESEAPKVHVGQAMHFTVLAYPDRVFSANISYVATALDTVTRRLLVRATIQNADHLLKPEMFASVTILTGEGDTSLAVPRDAIIYDGKTARVWVVHADSKALEQREIKLGLSIGSKLQVTDGLRGDEQVVSKGSLFVDRAAAGS